MYYRRVYFINSTFNFEQNIIHTYNKCMESKNNKEARLEIKLTKNQKKMLEFEAKYFNTTVSELVRGLITKEHEKKKK